MEGDSEFIAATIRFSLAALFLIAGLSKLGNKEQFERAVRGYGLLPARLAPVVAAGLPPIEIAVGLLLVAGVAIPAVALALVLLLGVFTFAVAFNLARGRQIDCGCFGTGIPRAITWTTVARNIALAAMAAVLVVDAPRALAADSLFVGASSATSHSDGFAALIVAATALAVFTLAVEIRRVRAALRRTLGVIS